MKPYEDRTTEYHWKFVGVHFQQALEDRGYTAATSKT